MYLGARGRECYTLVDLSELYRHVQPSWYSLLIACMMSKAFLAGCLVDCILTRDFFLLSVQPYEYSSFLAKISALVP